MHLRPHVHRFHARGRECSKRDPSSLFAAPSAAVLMALPALPLCVLPLPTFLGPEKKARTLGL